MYAVIGTRPDLAYTVTLLSQFSSNPTPEHLTAAKRVLRYIKGTINTCIFFSKGTPNATNTPKQLLLTGYSDASYASCVDTRRSFSGYVFTLNNCTISWCSQKQRSVAVSSTESEYMALSLTARNAIWLRNALSELLTSTTKGVPSPTGTLFEVSLLCDNQGSIALAHNPAQHKRSKHIDVHYHYTREKLEECFFSLSYVATGDNIADIFTKSLDRVKHQHFCTLMRLQTH